MADLTKSEAAANIRNTFNGIKDSIRMLKPRKTITKPPPPPPHQGWTGSKISWPGSPFFKPHTGGRRKSNRGKKHKSKQMKSRRSRR